LLLLIVALDIILFVAPWHFDASNKNGQEEQGWASRAARCKNLKTVVRAFWFFFIIVLILISWWGLKVWSGEGKPGPRTKGYFRREYGEQMEIDLRLPYKRFKQIYPYSKITYQEYKQLQMRNAFRVQ